jgi:hypothetical protein
VTVTWCCSCTACPVHGCSPACPADPCLLLLLLLLSALLLVLVLVLLLVLLAAQNTQP